MALLTNHDFADSELSIEELETIAAGSFWSTVEHIAVGVLKVALAAGAISAGYIVGGIVFGGGGAGQKPATSLN